MKFKAGDTVSITADTYNRLCGRAERVALACDAFCSNRKHRKNIFRIVRIMDYGNVLQALDGGIVHCNFRSEQLQMAYNWKKL